MSERLRVAVVGASGFVGGAVAAALEERGCDVARVKAPRLGPVDPVLAETPTDDANLRARLLTGVPELAEALSGAEIVVNCAGEPDASARDAGALSAANAVLPGVVGAAAREAGARRYVHVSSAVVQGRLPVLDSSERVDPFTAYSRSKVAGERWARAAGPRNTVLYRPPSVHARSRRVTRLTARIARSPLACVAAPADSPTPQALIENVGSAVAFLATCDEEPPPVVHHPWEGLTTAGLLMALSGKTPRTLPRGPARALVNAMEAAGRGAAPLAANARRVEMIWFGQAQARSWLQDAGWVPPAGPEAWEALGRELAGAVSGVEEHGPGRDHA